MNEDYIEKLDSNEQKKEIQTDAEQSDNTLPEEINTKNEYKSVSIKLPIGAIRTMRLYIFDNDISVRTFVGQAMKLSINNLTSHPKDTIESIKSTKSRMTKSTSFERINTKISYDDYKKIKIAIINNDLKMSDFSTYAVINSLVPVDNTQLGDTERKSDE